LRHVIPFRPRDRVAPEGRAVPSGERVCCVVVSWGMVGLEAGFAANEGGDLGPELGQGDIEPLQLLRWS
jgi:hypothetical protein